MTQRPRRISLAKRFVQASDYSYGRTFSASVGLFNGTHTWAALVQATISCRSHASSVASIPVTSAESTSPIKFTWKIRVWMAIGGGRGISLLSLFRSRYILLLVQTRQAGTYPAILRVHTMIRGVSMLLFTSTLLQIQNRSAVFSIWTWVSTHSHPGAALRSRSKGGMS
jgi:hypothetical protein